MKFGSRYRLRALRLASFLREYFNTAFEMIHEFIAYTISTLSLCIAFAASEQLAKGKSRYSKIIAAIVSIARRIHRSLSRRHLLPPSHAREHQKYKHSHFC